VKITHKGTGIYEGENRVFRPHTVDTWHIIWTQ